MSDEVKTPEKDDKSWKLSPEELKERREAQVAEITEKLEAGVKSIFSGEAYKSFLETMAKMPHYSVNNQVLIMMQTGGQATMCNSFTGWKEMGRHHQINLQDNPLHHLYNQYPDLSVVEVFFSFSSASIHKLQLHQYPQVGIYIIVA